MFPLDQIYLFRNSAMRLEYCMDTLEIAKDDTSPYDRPDEEDELHTMRKCCERYIAAHIKRYGDNPDTEHASYAIRAWCELFIASHP